MKFIGFYIIGFYRDFIRVLLRIFLFRIVLFMRIGEDLPKGFNEIGVFFDFDGHGEGK